MVTDHASIKNGDGVHPVNEDSESVIHYLRSLIMSINNLIFFSSGFRAAIARVYSAYRRVTKPVDVFRAFLNEKAVNHPLHQDGHCPIPSTSWGGGVKHPI